MVREKLQVSLQIPEGVNRNLLRLQGKGTLQSIKGGWILGSVELDTGQGPITNGRNVEGGPLVYVYLSQFL